MKWVKQFALALLLSVTATAAHASDSKYSLFQCGVQLGASHRVQKVEPPPKEELAYGNHQAVTSIAAKQPAVVTYREVTVSQTGRRRMPRTLPLARFGCSWR